MLAIAATLIAGTFVSEDAACLAAGALIARGDIGAPLGVGACVLGIFAGDMGLWVLGRAGARIMASKWFARRVPAKRLDEARLWLDRHGGRAILMSRFTPGARLPLYVASGLLRISPLRFAAWTLVASLLWTPVVVLAAAQAADAAGPLSPTVFTFAAAAALLAPLAARRISTRVWPWLRKRVARLSRWEFWPGWLFYSPVAAWVVVLSLRYRSLTILTACNPGIEDGGFVKLRDVSVAYTLRDQDWLSRIGFSTLDVQVVGRNLKTWTDYTGIDPESNLDGATLGRGIDYFNNPQTRSWGVNFTLTR